MDESSGTGETPNDVLWGRMDGSAKALSTWIEST